MNILKIIGISLVILLIILMAKFKPMYKVTIDGEFLGYVADKDEIEDLIYKYINKKSGNVAFVEVANLPEFKFTLVTRDIEDSSNTILQSVKDNSLVTYRLFEILVNDESRQYVATVDEAYEVVSKIKEEFDGMVDLSIGVQEIYTHDLDNIESLDTSVAVANLDADILESADNTIDGIILTKPITGVITSRYGERWGRAHTGIDISATTGTPIHSASKGTVSFAGWNSGGYGYLVIVDHENGIQTYYAHCSKIYVSVGDEVTKDTVLAEVGSTGNSTGPHLHFEIRKNGTILNPQNYIYN